MFIDAHGRVIDYLRLAVTDRCNLRCRYCMPEEGIAFSDRKDILSYEEIIRLSRLLSANGVRKIRITGGEPFVRKDIMKLLRHLNEYFKVINLTTNASLIHRYIPEFKNLKIGSINVSLDSLDKDRFFLITKRDMFDQVWRAIELLMDYNIRVKINAVIMKDVNDMEITDFVSLAENLPLDVRFIEAMPFNAYDENRHLFMGFPEILEAIKRTHPDIHPTPDQEKRSASVKYSIPGFMGNLGIIPAYSRSLCGYCNRMRVTAKGELMTCLYSNQGIDLMQMMRSGASDQDLLDIISGHIFLKEKDGFEAEQKRDDQPFKSMTTIGG